METKLDKLIPDLDLFKLSYIKILKIYKIITTNHKLNNRKNVDISH